MNNSFNNPIELVKLVESFPSKYDEPPEQVCITLKQMKSFDFPKQMLETSSFSAEINLSNTISFPDKLETEKIINEQILTKLNDFISNLQNKEKAKKYIENLRERKR